VHILIISLGKNINTLHAYDTDYGMRVYARLKFDAGMLATVISPTSLNLVIFRQITRFDVDCILHGHHVTTMRNSNFTLGQCFNIQV